MPAPTPNFQMVADVLDLPDKASCALHVTVTRAEPIDTFEYQNETRTKQFLLVEDAAGAKVGVRWFGPKFDLRAGDIVQMYPGAKEDRATCRIDTDNSGKRIVKVSPFGMLIMGPERPAFLPEAGPPAVSQQKPGEPPPNYSQPGNGGQKRPAAANGALAPVVRQRYDHVQILALRRAVFEDSWELVCKIARNDSGETATTAEKLDIATRLTATVVIAVVDGRIDLRELEALCRRHGFVLEAEANEYSETPGPAHREQGGGQDETEVDDDGIPFAAPVS